MTGQLVLICPTRGVQQEAPVPLPHHLPHGAHPLPGHHPPAAHQRAVRAGAVRLRPQGAGEHAQDGLVLARGQGETLRKRERAREHQSPSKITYSLNNTLYQYSYYIPTHSTHSVKQCYPCIASRKVTPTKLHPPLLLRPSPPGPLPDLGAGLMQEHPGHPGGPSVPQAAHRPPV